MSKRYQGTFTCVQVRWSNWSCNLQPLFSWVNSSKYSTKIHRNWMKALNLGWTCTSWGENLYYPPHVASLPNSCTQRIALKLSLEFGMIFCRKKQIISYNVVQIMVVFELGTCTLVGSSICKRQSERGNWKHINIYKYIGLWWNAKRRVQGRVGGAWRAQVQPHPHVQSVGKKPPGGNNGKLCPPHELQPTIHGVPQAPRHRGAQCRHTICNCAWRQTLVSILREHPSVQQAIPGSDVKPQQLAVEALVGQVWWVQECVVDGRCWRRHGHHHRHDCWVLC